MASRPEGSGQIWQHPFVNVFKQFDIGKWKRVKKEGDVVEVMDSEVKCTVYRIQGSIPAGNYIQLPHNATHSLGLTGRYFYMAFKPLPCKYFVVHLDVVDDEQYVVRVSFSNLFKQFRSTSSWLQFPFACLPPKGSVEERASRGAKINFVGPAPASQRWTLLVLDMGHIFSTYTNRKYSHIKSMRFCANMLIKNCYTSDIQYDPRLSAQQARKIGITSVDENFAPLPREMSYYLPKQKTWDHLYDIVRFPATDQMDPEAVRMPFDSIQRQDSDGCLLVEAKQVASDRRKGPGVIVEVQRNHVIQVPGRRGAKPCPTTNMPAACLTGAGRGKRKKKKKKQPPMFPGTDPGFVTLLPPVGLKNISPADREGDDTSTHVHAGTKADDGCDDAAITSTDPVNCITANMPNKQQLKKEKKKEEKSQTEGKSTLLPDPIMRMERVVGFGHGKNANNQPKAFREMAHWHPESGDGKRKRNVVAYASGAVVVAMDVITRQQRFFLGHTQNVTSLAFNQSFPVVMVSSQLRDTSDDGGASGGGIVRVWHFDRCRCAAVVDEPTASGVERVALSRTGAVLVGAGRDGHGKSMLMVWDVSSSLKTGTYQLIAKAHAAVEINRIRVSPTHDTRIVTCGRDNLRFWRVKSAHLRSAPMSNTASDGQVQGDVTDITFAPPHCLGDNPERDADDGGAGAVTNPYNVFACTSKGFILEVDFTSLAVIACHKPTLPSVNKDKPGKALRFNTLKIDRSFVATGCEDGVVRLWPTSLASVFLEAKHEGSVADVEVDPDGRKLLVATMSATLGYLDIGTHKYHTLMRAHTDRTLASCYDELHDRVATCAADSRIHMWQCRPPDVEQTYNFHTPHYLPTCVAIHPSSVFAVGFGDGSLRVFDMEQMLCEHGAKLHDSQPVVGAVFTRDRLLTRCQRGTLCLLDAAEPRRRGVPLVRKLTGAVAPSSAPGIAVSDDGSRCAYVCGNETTLCVATSAMLDPLMRVDVSSGLRIERRIDELGLPQVDCPHLLLFTPARINHILVATRHSRLIKINAKTGALLHIASNLHKKKTTAMCVDDEARYLVTADDDGVVKVWDYKMSQPNCFQTFSLGHGSALNLLRFTLDAARLIAVDDASVTVWRFGGAGGEDPASRPVQVALQIQQMRDDGLSTKHLEWAEQSDADDDRADDGTTTICRKSVRFNDTQGRGDVSKLDCDCEGATKGAAPAPTAGASNGPDTLHASDLEVDETDAEFTIDGAMMERLVLENADGVEKGATEMPCQQLSPDVSIVRQESSAVPAPDDPDFDDDDAIVEIGSSESYDDLRICAHPRAGVASVAEMNGDIQYSSQHLRRKMGQVESKTSHVHANANGEVDDDDEENKKRLSSTPITKVWGQLPSKKSAAGGGEGGKKGKRNRAAISITTQQRPDALSYYKPRHDAQPASAKCYIPPPRQQALKLHAVIGYNGNGRGNLVWDVSKGRLIYSCGCIGIVEEIATNRKKYAIGHAEEISTLALQHDSKIFATASGRNGLVPCKMVFWQLPADADGEVKMAEVVELHDHQEIVHMSFSPHDKYLLTVGGYDSGAGTTVSMWTTHDGRTDVQLLTNCHVSPVIIQACWNPLQPDEFVTVGNNASIIFWVVDRTELNNKLSLKLNVCEIPSEWRSDSNNHQLNVFTCAAFAKDLCFIGSREGWVWACSTRSNSCVTRWRASRDSEVTVVAASESRVMASGADGVVRKWLISDVIKRSRGGGGGEMNGDDMRYVDVEVKQPVTSCSFVDSLDMGIVGTSEGSLFHVDWLEPSVVPLVSSHTHPINGICFDGEGEFFATCCQSGSIRIWNAERCQLAAVFSVAVACTCVTFSPRRDGTKLLAAGFADGTLRLYDVGKLTRRAKLRAHNGETVSAVKFTPDSSKLLSADVTGHVSVTSIAGCGCESTQVETMDSEHKTSITNIDVSTMHRSSTSLLGDHIIDMSGSKPHLCLFTALNRRVSVWSTEWQFNKCMLVDWLTFPAPPHAPDGRVMSRKTRTALKTTAGNKKQQQSAVDNQQQRQAATPSIQPPKSFCYFHPKNDDILLYTGYGMSKSIQHYSLSQKKIVKTVPLRNWAERMEITDDGRLAAVSTSSRLIQIVDVDFGTFQDYPAHVAGVDQLCFSPNSDSPLLVSASKFSDIIVWRVCADEAMQD